MTCYLYHNLIGFLLVCMEIYRYYVALHSTGSLYAYMLLPSLTMNPVDTVCGLTEVCVLVVKEAELMSVENSAQVFNLLSDVPGDVQDIDELLQVEW